MLLNVVHRKVKINSLLSSVYVKISSKLPHLDEIDLDNTVRLLQEVIAMSFLALN